MILATKLNLIRGICRKNFIKFLQLRGLKSLGGRVLEAGDQGLDQHTGAVLRRFDDDTLPLVITFVLPLGLHADSVTDFKGYGLVARDGIFAVHDAKKAWQNLIMRTIKKVNDLHTKLTNFSSCSTILELTFAANTV